jgi:uncharacterized phage protein (TIGR02218 family)
MVYQTDEISDADGEPILLFEFSDSIGNAWRSCTGNDDIVYNLDTYIADVVDVSEIEISEKIIANEVKVQFGKGNILATAYINAANESPITVTIYRGHSDDYVTRWFGYVRGIQFDSEGRSTVRCEPRTSSMRRVGRRRRVQRLCDHCLYSQGAGECRVTKSSFMVTGTVSGISGTTITATVFGTKTDDWFKAGELVVGNEKRLIKSHTGTSVVVSRVFYDTDAGDSLTAYAGCDHLPGTCLTKFNNKPNYGGSERLPIANPFNQNINYGV